MSRFAVSFEFEGTDPLAGWTSPPNAENLTVTEMVVAGWYLRVDSGYVEKMSSTDIREYIEDYSLADFYAHYQAVDVVPKGEQG